MRILNAAQMREADRFTIEDIGLPSLVLMTMFLVSLTGQVVAGRSNCPGFATICGDKHPAGRVRGR